MSIYKERKFDLPDLKGISKTNVEEHLKLYSGYVNHTNLIEEHIKELSKDREKNKFMIGELRRRLGFEFDGMRNHEYFFEQMEGGPKDHPEECLFQDKVESIWGSYDEWLSDFKTTATSRGIGWAITYYDKKTDHLMNFWIDEQHIGHPTGLSFAFGLDMWEHSYVYDYPTSKKSDYVEAFFQNVNWERVDERFRELTRDK
jgi:superoxide dismutase, Fe-Mn family